MTAVRNHSFTASAHDVYTTLSKWPVINIDNQSFSWSMNFRVSECIKSSWSYYYFLLIKWHLLTAWSWPISTLLFPRHIFLCHSTLPARIIKHVKTRSQISLYVFNLQRPVISQVWCSVRISLLWVVLRMLSVSRSPSHRHSHSQKMMTLRWCLAL